MQYLTELAQNPIVQILINVFFVFLGVTIGGTFADIDLAPPLPISHRSFWTHGLLVPLALAWVMDYHPLVFWFALGFLPAYAIHLAHDMFPKRWHGGAKIKLFPIPLTLPALFSFLWLAAGTFWAGKMFVQLIWFTWIV